MNSLILNFVLILFPTLVGMPFPSLHPRPVLTQTEATAIIQKTVNTYDHEIATQIRQYLLDGIEEQFNGPVNWNDPNLDYTALEMKDFLTNDLMMHQMEVCGNYSTLLGDYLNQAGLYVYLIGYRGHYNLGTKVINDQGQEIELIIDGTVRQFFKKSLVDEGYSPESIRSIFIQAKIPAVLIVPSDQLEEKIKIFPLTRNWEADPQFSLTADFLKGHLQTKFVDGYEFFYHPLEYTDNARREVWAAKNRSEMVKKMFPGMIGIK